MTYNRLSNTHLYFLDLGLLVIALSWGASYSLMQLIIQAGVTIPLFLMLRFALSVPFMFIGTKIHLSKITKGELVNGLLFGCLLYVILTLETLGVKQTTAANAGFLIALSVVIVPFFERFLGKRKQSKFIYFTCILSFIGGGILSLANTGKFGFNQGDWIILFAALIRGFQIFMFGKQTSGKSYSLINITIIELAIVTLLGFITVLLFEPTSLYFIPKISVKIWGYILFLSAMATAFAFLMQLYAAKVTSPTRVGLILSLEPAFAALFAIVLTGEHIGVLKSIGGLMIISSALLGRIAEGRCYE
ncbi:DMT family transporter [Xenorhabdus sp. KJ12.1]|uniref:DMT family transporter n=1 Tax=Xenorhabdus sp. KJ12.1 TaxID=1851571 RepID=UPI000C048FEB|nr:DMT family transporter [Xenorhabdus sp. KJ12.1]PHM72169.1 hypothetical protein Xekj_00447 [Xenorhabdus sp. KJ12.1]